MAGHVLPLIHEKTVDEWGTDFSYAVRISSAFTPFRLPSFRASSPDCISRVTRRRNLITPGGITR